MKLNYNVTPPPKYTTRQTGLASGATAAVMEFYNTNKPFAEVVCDNMKSVQRTLLIIIKRHGLCEYISTRRHGGRLYLVRKDLFGEDK